MAPRYMSLSREEIIATAMLVGDAYEPHVCHRCKGMGSVFGLMGVLQCASCEGLGMHVGDDTKEALEMKWHGRRRRGRK